eukprot:SAG22_NODE_3624_length_1609_cov_4.163576_2_plen_223_part_00
MRQRSSLFTAFPCVSPPFLAVPLLSQRTVTNSWPELVAKCEAMPACAAYTWVNSSSIHPLAAGAAAGGARRFNRCALKKEVPDLLVPAPGMICGVSTHARRPFPPGASKLGPAPPPAPAPAPAPPQAPVPRNAVGLVFDPAAGTMGSMPLELAGGEWLRCHIYVDGPYVESICNNQTNRFDYGVSRGNRSWLVGRQRARSVDIWQLRSSAGLRSDVALTAVP